FEIAINTLATSDSDLTVIAFQGIAGGSGGAAFLAESSSAVASNITQIINEASASERNPRGGVAALRPRFKFNLSGDGMAPTPDYYVLDVLKFNPANNKWSKFLRSKLPAGATGYTPSKILPKGMYRWRLGFKQRAGNILDPAGDILATVKPRLLLEDSYAEFERLDVEPGNATLVSPSSFFTASDASVQYTFNAAINATSYTVFINRDGATWRKLTVKPPANNPGASTFTITVKGHKVGEQYNWFVVPLNYDHPKPVL
ncbi:MAG TPA: hypothetical protein VNT99_14335, partial [Methylomirabilota bacterium]|nr:hypothetical protein [Methylomirabilota bacterium]